jgi:hypothetical protein
MASGSKTLNGAGGFIITLTTTESSFDKLSNTSVVSYTLVLNPPGTYTSFDLTASNNTYSINIGGTVISGNFTYDFRSPNQNVNKTIRSSTVTITHDDDGTKTAACTATVTTTNSNVGDGTITSFNLALTTITPGYRWDGGVMVPTTTYQRFNGTSWVNLTIKKRYDQDGGGSPGSGIPGWVNISN